jgi:rod shape-determining protein MreD
MHWFRFAVLVLLATVLQASFFADLNSKPDLLLIFLVFFAVYCDTSDAMICSFIIGFAADLIGPTMGPKMISYGIFGSALAYLHRVIAIKKIPHQIVAIFITALLAGSLACSSLWDCVVLQHRRTVFILAVCMVDAYKKTRSIRTALNPFLVDT